MRDTLTVAQRALTEARPFVEAHRDYCLGKHGTGGRMPEIIACIDEAVAALDGHLIGAAKSAPVDAEARERFETWFIGSRKSKGVARREKLLDRREDDTYVEDHTQRHWWTWQNALAAAGEAGEQDALMKLLYEARELPDNGSKPPLFEAWMDELSGVEQGGDNFPRRARMTQREYILCRMAWKAALASAGQPDARDAGRLDFIEANPWWELSYGEPEDGDESDPLVWRIHELGGSRNDRVWTLKAQGATPREALDAAMRAKEGGRG